MAVRCVLHAAAVLIGCSAATAGMDIDEYMPRSELIELTDEEAQRQRERVLREAERARVQAAERERHEAAERMRIDAEHAARPFAVRLIEQRCVGCHDMELVTFKPRTRIGWEWVVLRMQWINGAALAPGERTIIATHLADRHRAPARRALAELATALLVFGIAGWLSWRRIRTHRAHDRNEPENPR